MKQVQIKKEELNRIQWSTVVSLFGLREDALEVTVNVDMDSVVIDNNFMTDTEKQKLAADMLADCDVKFPIQLARFGIYRQYELSGEMVSFFLLDDPDVGDYDAFDKYEDKLHELLGHLEDEFECGHEGQNILLLNRDGSLAYDTFTI